MKIEFISGGAGTRLILIFAGWSTDPGFYRKCVVEGWDTAVVYDYRTLQIPAIPSHYSTIYLFAYSIGVWAASLSKIETAANIAICGTPYPCSDAYGIPSAIFRGTATQLSSKSLAKFHMRMAGGKSAWLEMRSILPADPDIDGLRDELLFIEASGSTEAESRKWNRAYVADNDAIIPAAAQMRYWKDYDGNAEIVVVNSSHCADIASIIRECLPDYSAIGSGFRKASASYGENAVVQAEICDRIAHRLRSLKGQFPMPHASLLEIGPGQGMLSRRWSEIFHPSKAEYVDLCKVPQFGFADCEKYTVADAEEYVKEIGSKFDVILSASTIHWFADPIGFVRNLPTLLNPGGIAIVSTFLKGNLGELDALRPSPVIYRSEEDYLDAGVDDAEVWARTLSFPSARDMLLHLKQTGVSPSRGGKQHEPLKLSQLPRSLTYRPMIMLIHAPS